MFRNLNVSCRSRRRFIQVISIIQVCVAVVLHPITSRRSKSCECPRNPRSNIRRINNDPNIVVLDTPAVSKLSSDYQYDIKTEPPPAPKGRKKKGCCPYEFDSTNCRTINDRIQCGYDKNSGGLSPDEIQKELSGGCRLRFGRIECGYWYPPYVNDRRPKAWDNPPSIIVEPVDNHKQKMKSAKATSRSPANTRNRKLVSKFINTLEMFGNSKETLRSKNYVRVQQRNGPDGNQVNCVEIDDRIVCKPI